MWRCEHLKLAVEKLGRLRPLPTHSLSTNNVGCQDAWRREPASSPKHSTSFATPTGSRRLWSRQLYDAARQARSKVQCTQAARASRCDWCYDA